MSPSFSGHEPVREDAVGLPGQQRRARPRRGCAGGRSASSPTLNVVRSARSRSFVSSFLPEIVSARSATTGLPNRSVPATRTTYAPPSSSSTLSADRRPCPVFASVVERPRGSTSRSATRPALLDPLQDGDRQRLAGRLALGVARRGVERGTTRRRGRRRGSCSGRSGTPGRRASRPRPPPTLSCGSRADEPQRLLLGEPVGLELERVLARRRRSVPCEGPAVGQLHGDRPVRQRRAVLVPGDDGRPRSSRRGSRRSSAGRRPGRSSRAGTPGPRTRRRSRSCPAGRAGRGRCRPARPRRAADRLVERAELRERHRPGDELPAPAVGRPRAGRSRPGTLAYWPSATSRTTPRSATVWPGPVGRPVGVEVGPRR